MKKNYQTPKVKALKVQQCSIICASPAGFKTEKLVQEKFNWDDEEE